MADPADPLDPEAGILKHQHSEIDLAAALASPLRSLRSLRAHCPHPNFANIRPSSFRSIQSSIPERLPWDKRLLGFLFPNRVYTPQSSREVARERLLLIVELQLLLDVYAARHPELPSAGLIPGILDALDESSRAYVVNALSKPIDSTLNSAVDLTASLAHTPRGSPPPQPAKSTDIVTHLIDTLKRDVIIELLRQLAAYGTPAWKIRTMMGRIAAGLNLDKSQLNFTLFPDSLFIYWKSSVRARGTEFVDARGYTSFADFETTFNCQKLTYITNLYSNVVNIVQVESDAAQTTSEIVSIVENSDTKEDTSFHDAVLLQLLQDAASVHELRASLGEWLRGTALTEEMAERMSDDEIADRVWELATSAAGFHYMSTGKEKNVIAYKVGGATKKKRWELSETSKFVLDEFWGEPDKWEARQSLFIQLTLATVYRLLAGMANLPQLYNVYLLILADGIACATSTLFWFGGSWSDGLCCLVLGSAISFFRTFIRLKSHQLVLDFISCLFIGMTARMISLTWPEQVCYNAIVVGSTLNILCGFSIAIGVLQVIEQRKLAGIVSFLWGMTVSILIAVGWTLGIQLGSRLVGAAIDSPVGIVCEHPINQYWYIGLVPVGALSWAIQFTPRYADLPVMVYHGILAFVISYFLDTEIGSDSSALVAAAIIVMSGNFWSVMLNTQGVGFVLTGLYVLVPGAMAARSFSNAMYNDNLTTYLLRVLTMAISIGIGAFVGSTIGSTKLFFVMKSSAFKRLLILSGRARKYYLRPKFPPVHL